mgnify:CR=1 FL=1
MRLAFILLLVCFSIPAASQPVAASGDFGVMLRLLGGEASATPESIVRIKVLTGGNLSKQALNTALINLKGKFVAAAARWLDYGEWSLGVSISEQLTIKTTLLKFGDLHVAVDAATDALLPDALPSSKFELLASAPDPSIVQVSLLSRETLRIRLAIALYAKIKIGAWTSDVSAVEISALNLAVSQYADLTAVGRLGFVP